LQETYLKLVDCELDTSRESELLNELNFDIESEEEKISQDESFIEEILGISILLK